MADGMHLGFAHADGWGAPPTGNDQVWNDAPAQQSELFFTSNSGDDAWGVPSMHKPTDGYNPHVDTPMADAEFSGTCNVCNNVGHMAKNCPDKPPMQCRNCNEAGHAAADCTNGRMMDYAGVEDMSTEEAWEKVDAACADRDLDDFREAFQCLLKSNKELTYVEIENTLREKNACVYLIAYQQEIPRKMTSVSPQGKHSCTYVLRLNFSSSPRRAVDKDGWPASVEENLERLADCGVLLENHVPLCSNCDEMGHTTRNCPEERREIERVEIKCNNCGNLGHRVRDCPDPRPDPNLCRNCKKPGHRAADCTEERDLSDVECKRCNKSGHFAKDCPDKPPSGCRNCGEEGHMKAECPNPTNPALLKCYNCEQNGHLGRECPLPKNPANILCNVCSERGHMARNCPGAVEAPPAAPQVMVDSMGW